MEFQIYADGLQNNQYLPIIQYLQYLQYIQYLREKYKLNHKWLISTMDCGIVLITIKKGE